MKTAVCVLSFWLCLGVRCGLAFDASQLPPELREELYRRVVEYYRSEPAATQAVPEESRADGTEAIVSIQPAAPQPDPAEVERILQEQRRLEEERRKRAEHDRKVRELLEALGYDANTLMKEPAPAQEPDSAGNR